MTETNNRLFDFNAEAITQDDRDEIARIKAIVDKQPFQTCGTFGQAHFDLGRLRIRGRVFTGEAATYLQKHLEKATVMQDKIDREST